MAICVGASPNVALWLLLLLGVIYARTLFVGNAVYGMPRFLLGNHTPPIVDKHSTAVVMKDGMYFCAGYLLHGGGEGHASILRYFGFEIIGITNP